MNRVKEALRRIIDHQNREQKNNRDAYMTLDKQIKNLNISLGAYASDGGHLMDENSFLRKKRMNRAGGYSNPSDIFGVQGRKMPFPNKWNKYYPYKESNME